MACSCATPAQQFTVNTPQGKETIYPPVYELPAGREQEVQDAWKDLLAGYGLPFSRLELDPLLSTPRSLPEGLSGRINLSGLAPRNSLKEMEAKEAVRNFIERTRGILGGDPQGGAEGVKDLSLLSFTSSSNSYKLTYQQASYPFAPADGYGELRLTIDKNGFLLDWSSSLIPRVDLPASPLVKTDELIEKLLHRELTYTTIAGQPQTYRISEREQIIVKDLVVYPKRQDHKLTIHLAYPVEVGNEVTWTFYFDAINGQELGMNQNFAG